jgi:hypothetical protein
MLNLFQDRLKVVGRGYNRDPGLEFDCVLPPEVRLELFGPPKLTKPRITPARKPVRDVIVRIAGWLVLALLVALVLASNLHFYPDRPRPVEIKRAAPTITPTLPRTESTLASPALRAELVRLPAPRAELVKPAPPRALPVGGPEWGIGEDRLIRLPSGLQALARYKGSLTDESELPVIGNSTGDTWAVGDHFWLWLVEPGTTHPAWIDP